MERCKQWLNISVTANWWMLNQYGGKRDWEDCLKSIQCVGLLLLYQTHTLFSLTLNITSFCKKERKRERECRSVELKVQDALGNKFYQNKCKKT